MNRSTPNAHYDVIAGRPIMAPTNVGQVVTVSRSDAGIHMLLTEQAGEALATILARWDSVRSAFARTDPSTADLYSDSYDSDLWHHVGIDLLCAKALNLHSDHPPTTYATELGVELTRIAPPASPLQAVADLGELDAELRHDLGLPPRAEQGSR